MKYNNSTADTDNEKVNLFAEYFEKEVYAYCPNSLPFHAQVTRQANKIKENKITRPITTQWQPITENEVKQHIKNLRNSSTGPDNVFNRCLKNYTDSLIKHLTKLFNQVLVVGYIPKEWKKAYIILLLKPKKDKQQPSSYRPISLLSCLGKLLEKIIKQRLVAELERRNILPMHQVGFRQGKSTIYNILRLERFADKHLYDPDINKRKHAAVILFDIKAAFDSVWHDGLIYKLNDLRLPRYLVNYLISFLGNRTAAIELENVLSRPFQLMSGTPQGSPLSPILYIIYTADSMNGIQSHTEHGLFADDTAHYGQQIESWCKSWKLRLKSIKTEFVHFSLYPRKKYKNSLVVKVDNVDVTPVEYTRYLGVIFDKQLKWRKHLEHIERRTAPRIGLLRYLTRSAKEPNPRIMLNIFKSIVRTIIIYGHPVILNADQNIWKRLQVIQNKGIQRATVNNDNITINHLNSIIQNI